MTNGTATIRGQVENLVVINGSAILEGATARECLRHQRHGHPRRRNDRDRRRPNRSNATVTQDPAAIVSGSVRAADADLIAFGAVIAPAIVLFFLGFAARDDRRPASALAALAARQVRTAEALISHEPVETFVFGLAGLVVIPLVAILAMVTIIGAPLGLAILLMVWPAAAFAGYLVAGIWIGEWLLYRGDRPRPERPYLAVRRRADRRCRSRVSSRSSARSPACSGSVPSCSSPGGPSASRGRHGRRRAAGYPADGRLTLVGDGRRALRARRPFAVAARR